MSSKAKVDDEPITPSTPPSSPALLLLPSLIHNASLTNSELFGTILSTIKSSQDMSGDAKKWIHTSKAGHDAISSIVHRVAVVTSGYVTREDWIGKFDDAYGRYREAADDRKGGRENASTQASLGDIVRDMPSDGHAIRLRSALDAIDATMTTATVQPPSNSSGGSNIVSVRQAVGLLRGTAPVKDVELQSRALACLVRIMPQLASNPLEMLAVVQTPLLRLLDWKSMEEMGCPLALNSDWQRETFQGMINYGKEEEEEAEQCSSNKDFCGKHKRKRPWEEDPIHSVTSSSKINEKATVIMRLVEAAHLARRGDQRGAKHGAVLCIPSEEDDSMPSSLDGIPIQSAVGLQRVIGRGWNHNILLDSSGNKGKGKNKLVLHSEVHAVADAIRRFGERECFERLFPRATVLIVELVDDCAYEKCHPCPKCNTFLRAMGVTRALHSTPHGTVDGTDMSPANPELLARDVARVPFRAACTAMQIRCQRLEEVERIAECNNE